MAIRNLKSLKKWALTGAALTVIAHGAAFAQDKKTVEFDIDAQELGDALNEFGLQSGKEVFFLETDIDGKHTDGLEGTYSAADAINLLLEDTGIQYRDNGNGTILIGDAYIRQASLEQESGPFRVAQLDQEDDGAVGRVSDNEEIEERDVIVVTGSNIRGVGFGASPGFVFDKEEIEKSGYATVQRFVESLPQNFGGGQNEDVAVTTLGNQNVAANVAGSNSINLRGLGAGSTLVLLNGRRVAPSNFGDVIDTSMIPVSAVERVEVLTDGASAIYGSDAIGGVVNFVLRDDYEGAETSFRYGTVTDGGLRDYRVSQTAGVGWSSGNVLGVFEFYDRSRLGAEERDFSLTASMSRDLLPDQQRFSFLFSGRQELGSRVELVSDVLFADRETNRLSESFGVIEENVDSQQLNANLGANIEIADDWNGSIFGTYSKNKFDRLSSRNDVPIPPDGTESELLFFEGKLDGPIFEFGGNDVQLATGISYRTEDFISDTDGVIGDDADRDIFAAFGEVYLPIVGEANSRPGIERFEISAAVRFEDYSDFGSTTDPKIGVIYSPFDGLAFRGTYGTSFRAPNLQSLSTANSSVTLFNIPDPLAADGTTYTVFPFGGNPDLSPETATTWTAGLDFVPAEFSDFRLNLTYFQIRYEDRVRTGPLASIFLALQNDEVLGPLITRNPDIAVVQELFNNPNFLNGTTFFGPFTNDPADVGAIFDFRFLNLAETKTSGLDFSTGYSFDALGGLADVNLAGTYLFENDQRLTQTAPEMSVLDTVFNPIDLRLRGGLSWTRGGFSSNLFVNHADKYTNNTVIPEVDLESHTTIDFTIAFDTSRSGDLGVLNNTRISVSALNVFDEDPPFVESPELVGGATIGFDPNNADPRGRVISVNLTKRW